MKVRSANLWIIIPRVVVVKDCSSGDVVGLWLSNLCIAYMMRESTC